jgi:TonB family protein
MKEGRLGIFISIGVHLCFMALLMVSSFPVQNRPISVVEVDFSLAKDLSKKITLNFTPKMVKRKPLFLKKEKIPGGVVVPDQPVKENLGNISVKEQAVPPPVPTMITVSATPSDPAIHPASDIQGETVVRTVSDARRAEVSLGVVATYGGGAGSAGTLPALSSSSAGKEEGSGKAGEQGHESLAEGSENFNYIRDAVMKHIRYPDRARRLGFEGNVLLSFIVLENGTTSEIRVIHGSCYRILDESAKEAVAETRMTRTVPYRIVVRLPITYKLQGVTDGRT